MDAEIGVRNLADSFRYNTLPDVAKALGFDIENYKKNPEYAEIEAMEDLPDYEQLVWMVRSLPNPVHLSHMSAMLIKRSHGHKRS